MTEHLASIFGTENDRVKYPFYFKIDAYRHDDQCSCLHIKPCISPTLLLSNMYQHPDMITPGVDPKDLFQELSKYGDIQIINICDNLADHMVGNVYVQFREEDQAQNALQNLVRMSYDGWPIIDDFSPVTDFCEATCRQSEENVCNRGGYCNFMHLKKTSRYDRSRSRSRSPHPRNSDEREHHRSGRKGDHRHNDRGRRPRSRSPGVGGRRNARESCVERRAKIEQWNREREDVECGHTINTDDKSKSNGEHNDERAHENNSHPPEQGNEIYDY
ncbi:hypothetical protein ACS0TY_010956 [Phlomoides rotata]